MKAFYDLWYRFGTPPWVGHARSTLVEMVQTGDLLPGRAIDLGCGEGDIAIFLAEHGFQVTAVDFAPSAIAKAKAKASDAGVDIDFVIDDITTLTTVHGTFDILVDYGTFDDLSTRQRAAYVDRVTSLTKPGSKFLLWCFEWEVKTWERLASAIAPVTGVALQPGEVDRWFGGGFDIKHVAGETGLKTWPRGWAAYLMTRRRSWRLQSEVKSSVGSASGPGSPIPRRTEPCPEMTSSSTRWWSGPAASPCAPLPSGSGHGWPRWATAAAAATPRSGSTYSPTGGLFGQRTRLPLER